MPPASQQSQRMNDSDEDMWSVASEELGGCIVQVLAEVHVGTVWQSELTRLNEEELLGFEYFQNPTDYFSLRIAEVLPVQQGFALTSSKSFVLQRRAGVVQFKDPSTFSVQLASLTVPFWPYLPGVDLSRVALASAGQTVSAGHVLANVWGLNAGKADAESCLVVPLPEALLQMVLHGEWKHIPCLGRWHASLSNLPEAIQTSVGVSGHDPPDPQDGGISQAKLLDLMKKLQCWAQVLLRDDVDDQRKLELLGAIRWLANVRAALPGDHLAVPRPKLLYGSLFLVRCMLMTKLMPSYVNLKEIALESLRLQRLLRAQTTGVQEDRMQRLADHGHELLSWYARRVAELEQENKTLRSSYLKEADPQHFRIDSAEEQEEEVVGPEQPSENRQESLRNSKTREHSSLQSLFEIDWDDLGAELLEKAKQHCLQPLPSHGVDAKVLHDPRENLLALDRLLDALPESQSQLIWWQFARYESELGYLRSVIASYEEICLSRVEEAACESRTDLPDAAAEKRLSEPLALSHLYAMKDLGMIANMEKPASHDLLEVALRALSCMEHRGACSGGMDSNIAICGGDDSGDGAGVMTQIPWELFACDVNLPDDTGTCAVGMLFLSKDTDVRIDAKIKLESSLTQEGFDILGYRIVPVDASVLGERSAQTEPWMEQIFISHPTARDAEMETLLYIARKRVEDTLSYEALYVASLSPKTIVYKGMLKSSAIVSYYKDLRDPRYKVQYALWHRRFSTNTMPRWPLAQPFRYLGHNGEINTIQGNYNWTHARSGSFEHPNFGYRMREVLPPCRAENSDSGNMDCYLELILRCNRELPEALMMMIPEAYKAADEKSSKKVMEFYEYWGALQEAWDGPALVAFCDGEYMGATLDRNGLRPARYFQLNDGTCVVSSETGILDSELFPAAMFKSKGRLGPGAMVAIDLHTGELIENDEIKKKMAAKKPYGDWNKVFREEMGREPFLSANHDLAVPRAIEQNLMTMQFDMGYTIEDVEMVVEAMAQTGKEPTFCMGNDKPLAVVSDRAHVLYDYFTQRFAQVTNPAIDPYRESLVMSTDVYLGRQGNLMAETPTYFQNKANNRLVKVDSPFLNERQLYGIKNSGLLTVQLSTRYDFERGPGALEKALSDLCYEASNAIRNGAELIILSDVPRNSDFMSFDVSDPDIELERSMLAIPPLLAVGAVHHYLIQQGLRTQASLVVSTGQCWSTHHFACLIGYGASAVCPYLALAHIRRWHSTDKGAAKADGQTVEEVQANYKRAINAGLKKIMSKMGISVLESYRGAQIFQCIGLEEKVVERAFTGTPCTAPALSFTDIANESMMFHRRAFPELEETAEKLEFAGWYRYIKNKGEFHMNNPDMARALHRAVRNKEPLAYEEYRRQIMDGRPVTAIRDLLDFSSDRQPVPLVEVEDALSICNRFVTGGMSLGALSREAHEVIALGMNRIGGMSNSGEGGEDPVRFHPIEDVDEEGNSATFSHLSGLKNGDSATSATKQVASGRFGVTAAYLRSAKQLEIKIAQGAKPGEGGQLPGPKVDEYIARLRNSVPGVELISPPPHHDIYSIEDLAQLIFDLHQVSPDAKVSVKLVASSGIGTIAAGVAKANADVIQISGHDGGTGASPLSSIMHAGGPWEQGLSEVQGVLVENGLRNRVTLRVDGGIKTGWDIVVAAMMGAEEFGFGSVAMIAEGCIMARVCHMNRCPVGVATQREDLRRKFPGTPDHVANFMLFVAEEVRTIIAALGYRSLDEVIGRSDLLRPRAENAVRTNVPQPAMASGQRKRRTPKQLVKTSSIDLGGFFADEQPDEASRLAWVGAKRGSAAHSNGPVLDDEILSDPAVSAVIESNSGSVCKAMSIQNVNRSVGGRIAGAIASKYGDDGFKGEIELSFVGSAGQSFGVWNTSGVHLRVEGDCNDYVGKGINGGTIVATKPQDSFFSSEQNVIAGNTCLYGATGGQVFLSGRVGERFGIRNAGCEAVIEGSGDHLGEYMTNGVIVALGTVGRNVGAGMSGGLLYIYDPEEKGLQLNADNRRNAFRVTARAGHDQLKSLIQRHHDLTGSSIAAAILEDWDASVNLFWQVAPVSMQQSELVGAMEEAQQVRADSPVTVAARGAQRSQGGAKAWGASAPGA
ncbi:gltB [Symbiodinium sp. CCMP2592]|nr:gltB [Symbiodinium sp. CCMP2592]